MDIVTYGVLSKRINGILSGVKSTEIQGTSLVFNFTDGTSQTMTFPTPADGKDGANGISIVGLEITPTNHLIGTFSDGSVVDAGLITTIRGERGYTGTAGKDGKDGIDGADGVDGISPTVTITESTGRHTVSITDKDGVKSFVVKDGSALDTSAFYDKEEVDTKLSTKADITDMPVNLSAFNNDSDFITNTVSNLVNYYTKSDTYTQAEVNQLVSNINKLTSKIVDELPTTDISPSTIYLIKQPDSNVYMQYMYIDNGFAELGSTQMDLTDYVTSQKLTEELIKKADKTEIPEVPQKETTNIDFATEF